MRKLQLLIGIILAVGAAVGVLFVGQLNQPPTFDVVVAVAEIPEFSQLEAGDVAVDTQSLSPALAEKYVLAQDWEPMMAEGAAAIETLHPGQPILRVQVVSGAESEGLNRLAAALDDPDRMVVSVPVEEDQLPGIVPGDVIALFFSAGHLQAQKLITDIVEIEDIPTELIASPAAPLTGTGSIVIEPPEVTTTTVELTLPVSKWICNGVVYRLNQERKENPNYGAPGMESEPRYVEGEVKALDLVIHRDDAERAAFALAHGEVQVFLLPAITRPDVEAGTLDASPGVTWTDFESQFFADRFAEQEAQ
jgi:hypothetical protein